MRDLSKVLNDILEVIPKPEEDLIISLCKIRESIRYSAPELISMWWDEAHGTLIDYVSITKPMKDWEYRVWSIFTTRSVEEIKELMK
jgi:hypothetical protein